MSDSIGLPLLRAFATVADELHFGRAATRLRVSQPSLSQQIARLERVLGCRLLTRRPRVALTEAGATLSRSARVTLQDFERGIEATRRVARGESGFLTVGFGGSVLVTKLARAFQAFRAQHPAVELRLREMSTAAQLDALVAGTIDVGLGREAVPPEDIITEEVIREGFMVAVPRAHRLAAERRIRIKSLEAESFILFPRWSTPQLYDQIVALCRRAGFTPHIVQEAVEWLNIVSLVAAGVGVSIVPESFRAVRWRGVEYRPASPATGTTAVHLCYRTPVPPTAEAFVRIVRQVTATG